MGTKGCLPKAGLDAEDKPMSLSLNQYSPEPTSTAPRMARSRVSMTASDIVCLVGGNVCAWGVFGKRGDG